MNDLVVYALKNGYLFLPQIVGGHATWVATVDYAAIAVLAQQWPQPHWLIDPRTPVADAVHFKYLAQRDPDAVIAELAEAGGE